MGGKGEATNPEQLLAAGYSACFESAHQLVARSQKLNPGRTASDAKVSMGPNDSTGSALAVQLNVHLPDLERSQVQALVDAAHRVCAYSNATRGNLPVTLNVVEQK